VVEEEQQINNKEDTVPHKQVVAVLNQVNIGRHLFGQILE